MGGKKGRGEKRKKNGKEKRKERTSGQKIFKHELSRPKQRDVTRGGRPQKGTHTSNYKYSYFRTRWRMDAGGLPLLPGGSAFIPGRKTGPSQAWPCGPMRPPAGNRRGRPHGRRPRAAPPCGRSVCVSCTLISGHERASSQSPHSWTLHTGAANRKKLFLCESRKVGSCLLIEDHIKNAWLQMFFLRTSDAGGSV